MHRALRREALKPVVPATLRRRCNSLFRAHSAAALEELVLTDAMPANPRGPSRSRHVGGDAHGLRGRSILHLSDGAARQPPITPASRKAAIFASS